MWDWYKFKVNGKKLIWFEIRCSFHTDMYFMVCKDNDKYIVYWRTALSRNIYFDKVLGETHDILSVPVLSLKELVNTEEYKEVLNRYSPVYSAVLNENQNQIIRTFLESDIDKNVHKPCGRDGHSYYIEVFYPEFRKYHCWCRLPEEWTILADVINMLVDISQADYQKYGAKIYKEKFHFTP